MANTFRKSLICVLLSTVAASFVVQKGDVTPIDKVISLLTDLKAEVTKDGSTEAASYDKFACWCKDASNDKSKSVKDGHDKIETLSATIEAKSAEKVEKQKDKLSQKTHLEQTMADLKAKVEACDVAKATYEADSADLVKALSSIKWALKSLKDSMPGSFLEIDKSVRPVLLLADAMGMLPSKQTKAMSAFLQQTGTVDPNDPAYKFHSGDIISVLENLQTEFQAKKVDLDKEWEKTNNECKTMIAAFNKDIVETKAEIKRLAELIESLGVEIAEAREELVTEDGQMKDDKLYIEDLTKKCEEKAMEWDQRTTMRKNELDALTAALGLLKGDVKTYDEVNKRALLVQKQAKKQVVQKHREPATGNFLQVSSRNLLKRSGDELSTQARQEMAVEILRKAGQRLGQPMLSALAMKVAKDPFKKVKELIQKLIERLVAEAAAEATKKGWCDTEVGKATKERDYRFSDTKKYAADLGKLQAEKDFLESEIEELTGEIKDLKTTLEKATENRAEEKAANLQTLSDAKKGLAAVKDALTILKDFYRVSARTRDVVLLQASPIEEDNPGAGFGAGAYKGKQDASVAIISLVEQIKEDYERTIKQTEASEQQALADFVEFDRTSKSDTSAKSTKVELDNQDLETTKINMEQTTEDLTTAQTRLDDALKELEELKPMCIDTGMAYKERVAKREEEIAELKKALCILDPEKKEAECK